MSQFWVHPTDAAHTQATVCVGSSFTFPFDIKKTIFPLTTRFKTPAESDLTQNSRLVFSGTRRSMRNITLLDVQLSDAGKYVMELLTLSQVMDVRSFTLTVTEAVSVLGEKLTVKLHYFEEVRVNNVKNVSVSLICGQLKESSTDIHAMFETPRGRVPVNATSDGNFELPLDPMTSLPGEYKCWLPAEDQTPVACLAPDHPVRTGATLKFSLQADLLTRVNMLLHDDLLTKIQNLTAKVYKLTEAIEPENRNLTAASDSKAVTLSTQTLAFKLRRAEKLVEDIKTDSKAGLEKLENLTDGLNKVEKTNTMDIQTLKTVSERPGRLWGIMTNLTDYLDEVKDNVRYLSNDVDAFTKTNSDLSDGLQTLKGDVETLTGNVGNLSDTVNQTGYNVTTVSSAQSKLKNDTEILADALEALENLPVLQHTMDMPNRTEMELFMVYATGELSIVKGDVGNLTDDLDTLTEKTTSLSGDVTDVSDRVPKMREDVRNLTGELDAVKRSTSILATCDACAMMENMTSAIGEVRRGMGSLNDDVFAVNGDVRNLTRSLKELNNDVGSLNDELNDVAVQVRTLTNLTNTDNRENLPDILSKIRTELGNLTSDVDKVKDAMKNFTADLNTVKATAGTNQTESIKLLSKDMETLTDKLGKLNSDTQILTSDLSEVKRYVQTLTGDVSSVKIDVGNMTGDVGSLTQKTEDLSADLRTAIEALQNTMGELESLITALPRTTTDEPKNLISGLPGNRVVTGNLTCKACGTGTETFDFCGLRCNIANLTDVVKNMTTDVGRMIGEVSGVERDVLRLSDDLRNVTAGGNVLTGDVGNLKLSVGGLTSDLDLAKGDVTNLTGDVTMVKTDVSILTRDMKQSLSQMRTLVDKINLASSNATRDLEKVENIMTTIDVMRNLTAGVQELKNDVNILSKKVESLESDPQTSPLSKFREPIRHLTGEIIGLNGRMSQLFQSFSATHDDLQKSITENEKFSEQLQSRLDILSMTVTGGTDSTLTERTDLSQNRSVCLRK
ncbi:hypothetical protein BaRGS_00036698 [Batillaria attramentaria]|uniref:Uncharacterized protein n=1 Tax=Batillaria attramentaria TaxID=370345 RepID=A0ABD0JBM5_9CAEN